MGAAAAPGVRRDLPRARPRVPAAGAAAATAARPTVSVLDMGPVDPDLYAPADRRAGAAGHAADRPLRHGSRDAPPAAARRPSGRWSTRRRPGSPIVSLHCSTPGEVERLHPNDAAWRIAEYRLFQDPGFLDWVAGAGRSASIGFRAIRDAIASSRRRAAGRGVTQSCKAAMQIPRCSGSAPACLNHALVASAMRARIDAGIGTMASAAIVHSTVARPRLATRGRRRHRPRRARLRAVHRDGRADQVAERRLPGARAAVHQRAVRAGAGRRR